MNQAITPRPRAARRLIDAACCSAVLASLLLAAPVAAQQFPTRQVRIVVPYTPGGGIDVLARLLGSKLAEAWGQPVVIENKPGAGANLGVDMVAKSPADGYSYVIVSNTLALTASSGAKLPFDPLKDLAPALLATHAPFVLGVTPKLGATNMKTFLEAARARPGGLNFASAGQGTSTHLAIELLKVRTGLLALHVPYKGSGPAMTDLIDGRVDALFATPAAIMPYVRDKRLVAAALTSKARSSSAPGVPTMMEQGVPDYDVSVWFGLLAPAGTPPAILRKFHQDGVKALAIPDVVEKLRAQGQEVATLGPDEFTTFFRNEINTWAEVIKTAGIKFN